MITAVIGTTRCSSDGSTTFSPSTAESTEIAGVIMLSPKNSEAPKIPSAASAMLACAGRPGRAGARISVISAMIPPSPSLSARITSSTYLKRDDDRHRPEDQRDDAVDALGVTPRPGAGRSGLKTVWIV